MESVRPDTSAHNQATSCETTQTSETTEITETSGMATSPDKYRGSIKKLESENEFARRDLFEFLQLRSKLVEAASHTSSLQSVYNTESSELQMRYIKLHSELDHQRRQMASLTSQKVRLHSLLGPPLYLCYLKYGENMWCEYCTKLFLILCILLFLFIWQPSTRC